MQVNRNVPPSKSPLRKVVQLFAAAMLSGFGVSAHAQTLNLSDLPLSVQSEIPPNIIVSIDDSGSMAWGWMPDGRNSAYREVYYRSAHYNKIYYDPTVTYTAPNNPDGTAGTDADYFDATRGYYYSASRQQQVDLSDDFRALYYHYSTGAIIWLGKNAQSSYGCASSVCDDEPAFYWQFNDDITVNPGCTGTDDDKLTDSDCYDKVVIDTDTYPNAYGRTLNEERTNFANWFQYYSTRADASKSALRR
ncbi:MAG: hypothetical protein WBN40_13010, partial [Pseudomonadales bacterium]